MYPSDSGPTSKSHAICQTVLNRLLQDVSVSLYVQIICQQLQGVMRQIIDIPSLNRMFDVLGNRYNTIGIAEGWLR